MQQHERIRELLDERGVVYTQTIVTEGVLFTIVTSKEHYFILMRDNDAGIEMWSQYFTPEQAIAATLGDADATSARQGDVGTCQRVYLVETSDDLLESWYPFAVYLHREAAEDCAEALRTESDGVRSFAKVSELKVVSE